MNPQPFQVPPRSWPSRLNPAIVRLYTKSRLRDLRRQKIDRIHFSGAEKVTAAIDAGCGVLLVSNHSYHYDSYVMIESGRRNGWTPHIMTAWQVFMMYSRLGQWVLQRHGCFSINREGTDKQAIQQAVFILTAGPHPLLIYPEGDIYHSNDRVMPFREGAAAIGLLAAKKKIRPITIIPAAMKCYYTVDPTAELNEMMSKLEMRIGWRPDPGRSLLDRIYRLGNGFLAVKEVEYLGKPHEGTIRQRLEYLANSILTQIRERHHLPSRGNDLTERIREIRIHLIRSIEQIRSDSSGQAASARDSALQSYQNDLQDLFFVTQLSSYHGDYSSEKPTIERMAETIDKLEEDLFATDAPTPRGRRDAYVRFGHPIELTPAVKSAAQLTLQLEREVQTLLDQIVPDESALTQPDSTGTVFSSASPVRG